MLRLPMVPLFHEKATSQSGIHTVIPELTDNDRQRLMHAATLSLEAAAQRWPPPKWDMEKESSVLQEQRASFVTLLADGDLRGCIGTLESCRPLLLDVADNVRSAALHDPRFAPVQASELVNLSIHLSLLSSPRPFAVADEADLFARLRPGQDGLILRYKRQRATFLPSVWEQLPDPRQFVHQLKRKAGLPADFWHDDLRFERYGCEAIE